jgi:hypothetical protein
MVGIVTDQGRGFGFGHCRQCGQGVGLIMNDLAREGLLKRTRTFFLARTLFLSDKLQFPGCWRSFRDNPEGRRVESD